MHPRGCTVSPQSRMSSVIELKKKMKRRIYGGIIRYFENGKYVYAVVFERNANAWSFPKGTMKRDEEPRQCANRKIERETGITQLPMEARRIHVGWTHLYLFTVHEKYPLQPNDKTITHARWMTLEELEQQRVNLGIEEFIHRERSKSHV
jgi:8-oxo-dGTP pyrophosphatase MutT (NUDIX family)